MSLAIPPPPHLCEIAWREPQACLAAWAGAEHVALLHSQGPASARSRHSYLCVEPFQVLEATDGVAMLDGRPIVGDPFEALRRELARFPMRADAAPVPFGGGVVGFLGYGLARCLERLPARHEGDPGVPDMSVAFYDVVLGFDHLERRCWLLSSGFPETDPVRRSARATARATAVAHRLDTATPADDTAMPAVAWRPDLDRAAYVAMVERAIEYIRAGDIFQANLTARHVAPRPPGLQATTVLRALCAHNPAPFAALLQCGPGLAIVSASPERFLRLDGAGRIETRPIKGTRPRHADPAIDDALRRELADSDKDRAENLMIVDLMRNDLGRVARIGSVRVPVFCEVESFAAVHQLVSAVEATLRPGLTAIDLLRATFPGGSVTGAPKPRAMEVIDELEVSTRGPYCGAIAWIGFDGAMDSSIVIRTLVLTRERIVAQAGGAITADSDPDAEYEEMLTKLRPLLAAFGPPP